MLRGTSVVLFCSALVVSVAAVTLSATADAKQKPGAGKTKVVICHKGRVTIRVGLPAVKAHLRHGDTLGRCGAQAAAPHTARLAVVKNLINDNGGTKAPGDFTVTINGVTATGGNTFAGSSVAVVRTITTFGAYSVTESSVSGYAMKSAPGCSGTIAAGQDVVCVLTNDDVPATITVVKNVLNDHGGTKGPGDFTITIGGVTTTAGNTFAGSAAGVTKTLTSVGAYGVSEAAVAGYALQSASADCVGVIALGQSKTCTLTNNDV